MMKAIRIHEFGPPEVLQLAEISTPEPGQGEVLVEMRAIGVNPVETYIRSGHYARKPSLPCTPGTDGAGIVAKLGGGVHHLAIGQRVWLSGSLSGTYAAHSLCAAENVHLLPDAISFEQGAALGIPYTTAHFALFTRAQVQPGETVLIHGASGGVGLAALQFARAHGHTVFATAGTGQGRDLVREHGATEVFDHNAPDYLPQILVKTEGRGLHVILEMLANANLSRDLTLLAPRGRIAVIGSRGPIEINPREIMARNADIRGIMLFAATPAELDAAHQAIAAGLASGTLRPIIGQRFPLAEAAKAHTAILTPGARGKIVLVP